MKKMDSKLESVLQKVRGLLALSGNNPSQAEAQAAAEGSGVDCQVQSHPDGCGERDTGDCYI